MTSSRRLSLQGLCRVFHDIANRTAKDARACDTGATWATTSTQPSMPPPRNRIRTPLWFCIFPMVPEKVAFGPGGSGGPRAARSSPNAGSECQRRRPGRKTTRPSPCNTPRSDCAADFCARRGVRREHISVEIRNRRTTKLLRKKIQQALAQYCMETARRESSNASQNPSRVPYTPLPVSRPPGRAQAARPAAAA